MTTETPADGPVVFSFDGSDLAKAAIQEAGALITPGRDALVLTVWQPFDVGFVPASGIQIDSQEIEEVRKAAEHTAADGASLAEAAGFRARGKAAEGSPIWKAIVDFADERNASLIVLGSHGRSGIAGMMLGSVAGAVASHSKRSVLITHQQT
jgi:nucleotide-binding universal stress UspA family protein